MHQGHSFPLQLIEASDPPAHGEDKSLDRSVDLLALPGRPNSVGGCHPKISKELAADKVSTGQKVRSHKDHPAFRDWVRTSQTRRGIATSVVRTLINAASTYLDTASQIVIRMDQANLASASIAQKLGFALDTQEDREIAAAGHTGRGYVWVLGLPSR